jgi:endonuclease YncB( thermonuclease family)
MSRRRLPSFAVPNSRAGLFFILMLLLVVAVTGIPYLIAGKDAQRAPYEQVPTTLQLPAGVALNDLIKIQVEDVIDGDTIDGFRDGKAVRVRYFGVDTPEAGDRCYREAVDRNLKLVGAAGLTILLLQDERTQDQYGRLLGYVFTEDGTSVDATLVAEGFGEAWRKDGQYRDQIITLQEQAQATGRGCLWAE